MSKLTVKLPDAGLFWWRLGLPVNEAGNYMMVSFDNVDNPTEAVYEFFDVDPGQITGVAAMALEQDYHRHYLYLLCPHRPSEDSRWEVVERVTVIPPFKGGPRRFPDIGEIPGQLTLGDY